MSSQVWVLEEAQHAGDLVVGLEVILYRSGLRPDSTRLFIFFFKILFIHEREAET